MSLNLGLESLGIATDDVSFESVLTSQVEAMEARASFEHAMFDLATTARNVANFNEIVGSLSKHSSVECAEFAQELLGVPSVEAAKEVKIPLEKQSKAGKTLSNWAEKIKAWIKKCYEWVKKQLNKLLNKVGLTSELTRNPKVKVHWTSAQLKAFVDAAKPFEGKSTFGEADYESLLKIKIFANKPKGAVLDMAKDTEHTYIRTLLGLQISIYGISTAIRQSTNDQTSGKQLKYQSALLSRLQNTQKYVLADVKAITDASLGAAKRVTGKFADVQEKTKALNEKINETKKSAPK